MGSSRKTNNDRDASAPGELGFAHLAGALQSPRPVVKRSRKAAPAPTEPSRSPEEAVAHAEALLRSGHPELALAACEQALPMAEAAGDKLSMAIALHLTAACHQYAGRLKEAMLAGYRAIAIYTEVGATERLMRVFGLLSHAVARMGDVTEALDLLNRAMKLAPLLGERWREQCIFWVNASATYHTVGQIEQALHAAERATELALQLEPNDDLRWVALGNQLQYQVQRIEAQPGGIGSREHREKVDALDQHIRDVIDTGLVHLAPARAETCGAALIKMGDLDRARDTLRRGINAALAADAQPTRGVLELRLAEVERLSGQYRAAAAHVTEATALIEQGHDIADLASAHLESSLLQEAQQHWRAALDGYKRYAELREALNKAQGDARTQALAARVEVERGRVEAELLRLRNAELERNVGRLADEADELKRQALEDPLTGLANRRMFEQRLAQMRLESPGGLALLLGDIDHFKRINDSCSHAIGDAVLREIGRLLRESSRPHDIVARYGGEEFAIAFGGGLPLEKAKKVAERLRVTIQSHDWRSLAPDLQVTISIGLTWCGAGEERDAALLRADTALYASKNAGRNQVRCAP